MRLLREDYLNGNLSDKEINQVEQLRDWGWQNIRLFGLKIAHKMMSSYKPTSEQFHDVEVDLYEVYWNKVAEYDSTKGTPTTFLYGISEEPYGNSFCSPGIMSILTTCRITEK